MLIFNYFSQICKFNNDNKTYIILYSIYYYIIREKIWVYKNINLYRIIVELFQ